MWRVCLFLGLEVSSVHHGYKCEILIHWYTKAFDSFWWFNLAVSVLWVWCVRYECVWWWRWWWCIMNWGIAYVSRNAFICFDRHEGGSMEARARVRTHSRSTLANQSVYTVRATVSVRERAHKPIEIHKFTHNDHNLWFTKHCHIQYSKQSLSCVRSVCACFYFLFTYFVSFSLLRSLSLHFLFSRSIFTLFCFTHAARNRSSQILSFETRARQIEMSEAIMVKTHAPHT